MLDGQAIEFCFALEDISKKFQNVKVTFLYQKESFCRDRCEIKNGTENSSSALFRHVRKHQYGVGYLWKCSSPGNPQTATGGYSVHLKRAPQKSSGRSKLYG